MLRLAFTPTTAGRLRRPPRSPGLRTPERRGNASGLCTPPSSSPSFSHQRRPSSSLSFSPPRRPRPMQEGDLQSPPSSPGMLYAARLCTPCLRLRCPLGCTEIGLHRTGYTLFRHVCNRPHHSVASHLGLLHEGLAHCAEGVGPQLVQYSSSPGKASAGMVRTPAGYAMSMDSSSQPHLIPGQHLPWIIPCILPDLEGLCHRHLNSDSELATRDLAISCLVGVQAEVCQMRPGHLCSAWCRAESDCNDLQVGP